MGSSEWLKENLQRVLALPAPATEWLLMLWGAIQVFDDVADGDPVEREDLNAVIWNTLVGMNQNSFWAANSLTLAPVVATMILKWQGSDQAERAGKADARSYVWRAGYYDVVMMVVALCHGTKYATDNAHLVMALYGETLEDYMKEFGHA
jgi:predicted naringenin-chalcone synthase